MLKSFAVPKEPPVEKGVKRLAVAVEDHELGYEKFEGRIPPGQYGAGEVKIWDSGTYIPIKYSDSEITMDIKGKKLKGIYHLIKLKPTTKFKGKKNWLLFKA